MLATLTAVTLGARIRANNGWELIGAIALLIAISVGWYLIKRGARAGQRKVATSIQNRSAEKRANR